MIKIPEIYSLYIETLIWEGVLHTLILHPYPYILTREKKV